MLAFSSWTKIPEAENLKEGSTASKPVFAADSLMAVQPVALSLGTVSVELFCAHLYCVIRDDREPYQ